MPEGLAKAGQRRTEVGGGRRRREFDGAQPAVSLSGRQVDVQSERVIGFGREAVLNTTVGMRTWGIQSVIKVETPVIL